MAHSKLALGIVLTLVLLSPWAVSSADDSIPLETQRQIIADYMFVTGQKGPIAFAAAVQGNDTIPVKCGTSAVADFVLNRDKLDRRLMASLGVQLLDRPILDTFIISPSGHFKVHYAQTGADTVYRASQVDSRGVPIFVDSVAAIADRAWAFTIDSLGYPAPPSDGFYDSTGAYYDIFLLGLPSYYFGLTYIDSTQIDGPGTLRATSFLELDNDYQQVPGYENRPLDAVRVTVAHEFFHSVQFGIDFSEAEVISNGSTTLTKRYWMEMSAVWMEEQQYTSINDYYSYLPSFFSAPMSSIQQFNNLNDLHPYGSVVLPLYLSQRFGRAAIREIWLKCGQLGAGPNFLIAANQVLDSIYEITTGVPIPNGWSIAFSEFALWNYFTGTRAGEAPAGTGYTERANYPIIPDSALYSSGDQLYWKGLVQRVTHYPDTSFVNGNPFLPEANAATYIRLTDVQSLSDRYWAKGKNINPDTLCVLGYVDSLYDSTATVRDSSEISYSFIKRHCGTGRTEPCAINAGCSDTTAVSLDSVIALNFSLGQVSATVPAWPWGLNILYGYPYTGNDLSRVESHNDSVDIESFILPPSDPNFGARIDMFNKRKFSTITLIFTASSIDYHDYTPRTYKPLGYLIDEWKKVDSDYIDVSGAVLTPYPNPAVIAQMGGRDLRFRFQVPTDSLSQPVTAFPSFTVDIFTVAGERVRTLKSAQIVRDVGVGIYEAGWNMKNDAGNDVASGVYLAVARLYSGSDNSALVAEKRVKVLIVR